jgi:hypothetical protein
MNCRLCGEGGGGGGDEVALLWAAEGAPEAVGSMSRRELRALALQVRDSQCVSSVCWVWRGWWGNGWHTRIHACVPA